MKKVNISIDDISPHPMSSVKVLERCFEIIKIFPKAKFSLFVPIAYWRTIKPSIATNNALRIDMFPEFCKILSTLPEENFELCYHGFYHGIPGKSDNDEFQYLNYNQAVERFNAMFEVVKLSNLEKKFKMIFRPPAWRMSPDAIQAAEDVGIKLLALSSKEYAKKTYAKRDEDFKKVIYYNVNPPFDALKLHDLTEIVYHACEWDQNYLSKDMTCDLVSFLKDQKDTKFCFLGDM